MDTATREKDSRAEDSRANKALEMEIEVSLDGPDVPPSMWTLVASHLGTSTDTDTDVPSAQSKLPHSLSAVEGDAIATGVGRMIPARSRVAGRLFVAALVVLSLGAGFTLVYLIG